jgi:hypothetical protein
LFARPVFQAQPGIAQDRFGLAFHPLTQNTVALAQNIALLRIHLQPTLGVSPEGLLFLGREMQHALRASAKVVTAAVKLLAMRPLISPRTVLRKSVLRGEDRKYEQ